MTLAIVAGKALASVLCLALIAAYVWHERNNRNGQ